MKYWAIIYFSIAMFLISSVSAFPLVDYDYNVSLADNESVSYFYGVVHSSSIMLRVLTNEVVQDCRYSETSFPSGAYNAMEGSFDTNLGNVQKKSLTGLKDGMHTLYIRCRDDQGEVKSELKAMFGIDSPISADISLSKDSPLNSGRVEVILTTSKIPSETPSLSYSFDGTSFTPIPLFGSESIWNGYIIIPDKLGDSIGSFKFSAKDLGGISGNEITEGGIFLVDTTKPSVITNIKSTGMAGMIELRWDIDEEISDFNIYRSVNQNVRVIDFYKIIDGDGNSFTDTNVESGKTYYYRIAGIDGAGNEADLSVEVYATALLNNISNPLTGLSPELVGFVDSSLSGIDSVRGMLDDIISTWESRDGNEKDIFLGLRLDKSLANSKSEIDSLRRDILSYKSQILSRSELDNKLNSAQIKLNSIKKNIPESIIITDNKEFTREIGAEEIEKGILQIKPDIGELELKKSSEESLGLVKDSGLKVTGRAFNMDIINLDGTRRSQSIIMEEFDPGIDKKEGVNIILSMPLSILDSQVDIKNLNYKTLKDGIFSFSSDTKEIIYSFNKHVSLNLIEEAELSIVYIQETNAEGSTITGYSIFSDYNGNGYIGFIVGGLIVLILASYLVITKIRGKAKRILRENVKIIELAQKNADDGKLSEARDAYNQISKNFESFSKKQKHEIVPSLQELCNKIHLNYCKGKIDEMKRSDQKDKQKIMNDFRNAYHKLPEKYKKELSNKISEVDDD